MGALAELAVRSECVQLGPRAQPGERGDGHCQDVEVCYDQIIMIDSSWLMFPMFPALLSAVFFAAGIVTVYAADGAYPQIRS